MTEQQVFTNGEDYLRAMADRHKGIFAEILQERIRQELKWGVQEHHGDRWNTILGEERGEIERALNELEDVTTQEDLDNLREEIIQTMAVGAAWLDDWDRRGRFKLETYQ